MKNIAITSALASLATVAAVLLSIAGSASALWRDDSIAACCDYLSGDRQSIKIHEMSHAPGHLQDRVWKAWAARCKAASVAAR